MAIIKKTEGHLTITDLTDITDIYLQYGLALANATVTNSYTFSETGEIGWSTTYPTWTSGYQIWIRQVRIKEGINNPEYGTPYIDTAVNQLNNNINSLQTKTKYFWTNLVAHTNGTGGWTKPNYLVGTYAASGISGVTFDEEDSSTYGYNTLYANGIKLRYNAIDLGQLTGSSLIFYTPSTSSQGSKAMELTSSALNFYNSSGTLTSTFGDTISLASNGASITIGSTQNEHITIDTNGLKIYGNYSYNNNGTPASMYGLLGSFGNSVQIGPLNTGHIILNTTGATFYDSANTTIGVIGNTDLYYSTENYEEVVEVNWVSNETFTYDKQFNYDTNINSILVAIKNGDNIDWSSAQTVTSPWGTVYINLGEYMVPISISPSAVTGRTDCIFSSTSTNPITDTTLAFKINHTPSMPGPHYSFGIGSTASGTGSFAAGVGIQAVGPYQMALGRYNKKDLNASFIIGNGTDNNNRSNLFVVDGDGNLRVNNGFQIYNNDETDSIAEFGTTARIGKINDSHFLIGGSSLQAYNSSNQLYFEVSSPEITETQILNSTSGILDLSYISWNTNFDLIFTIYFAGYSTTLAPTITFKNLSFIHEFGIGYGPSGKVWTPAADYSGEQLPSGSVTVGGTQTATGEKALNYNITITGNGLTLDYASVTIIQKTATITDKVFLTFGNRKENSIKGLFSSAMGLNIVASGEYTYAEGRDTTASGDYSHAKGYNTIAAGIASYAEGDSTRASGKAAHAEGNNTIASGDYSHAEGDHTIASGDGSHVEGMNTVAGGNYSHAEGKNTTASGLYSHTEGFYTVASGNYSHASGCKTMATIDYQTVFGKYNAEDSEAMFIVGNGANDNNRSNLMVVGNNYIRIGNNSEASNNIQINPNGLTINHSTSSIFHVGEADSTELGYTTETFNKTITGSSSNTTITIQLGIGQTPPSGSTITLNRSYSSSAAPPYEHYTAGTSETVTNSAYSVIYDGAYTFTITVNSGYSFTLYAIRYATTSTAGGKLTLGSRINTAESTLRPEIREDGFNSTTLGTGLQAYTPNQLVIGKYNKGDSTLSVATKHAFTIGNGSMNSTTGIITESNALTVDWDGNIVIPNNSAYESKTTGGIERRLCFISPSNYYYYGYDSYNNNEGRSYFDGNTVYIRSKDSINMTGTIYPSTNIVMPNNVSVRAKTANGNNNYSLIYANDSNNIVIGNSSWNDCYIYRVYNSGTGTVSTVPNVRILDNGRLTRTTHANSSIKIKHDIKDIENKELDPHRLYGVEVKQFIYNDDVITDKNDCRYHKEIAGFIAEQLHECYPIAVDINEKGECEAWQAQYIIPPMLKLIQEQHEEIEQLKKEVAELKNR